MIPVIVFGVLGFELACGLALAHVMADGPVFTRAAFADLRVMASRAMHRLPRERSLRERIRDRLRDGTLPLDDLETPLASEPNGPPCPPCLGMRSDKPCCCTSDCGAVQCSGTRQP